MPLPAFGGYDHRALCPNWLLRRWAPILFLFLRRRGLILSGSRDTFRPRVVAATSVLLPAHARSDIDRIPAMAAADVAPQFGAELKVRDMRAVSDVHSADLSQLNRTTSNP